MALPEPLFGDLETPRRCERVAIPVRSPSEHNCLPHHQSHPPRRPLAVGSCPVGRSRESEAAGMLPKRIGFAENMPDAASVPPLQRA